MAELGIPVEVAAPVPPTPLKNNPKLAPNPFSNDDGTQPPAITAAKEVAPPGRTPAVVSVLGSSRVLVPMMPHERPSYVGPNGEHEEDCDSPPMITVEVGDGRHALPVFSSFPAMTAWNAEARPVPVYGVGAARTALNSGIHMLLLDPDDEAVLIGRPATLALANEVPWIPAWEDPEVTNAVISSLVGIEEVGAARVEVGQSTEVRIVLALRRGLDADQLRSAITRASEAIGAAELLRERVDSIELYPTSLPE